MREKVKFVRHIGVLFLTVIIFVVGILIGGDVEQLRVQNLYTQLQEQDLDYQNILTEGDYIDYLVTQKEAGKNVSCDTIKGAYYTSIGNLDDSRLKLEGYINTAKVKEVEYGRLKDHYANLQINYWIAAKRISGLCEDKINTILYFFAEDKKECPACEDQGVHLSYVKQKLGDDVMIFNLNAQDIGATFLIGQQYEVIGAELPVLVINDNVTGFTQNAEIFEMLE